MWQYSRQLPKGVQATVKRNIAIYGDKLFAGTSDVHVIALDVKTGRLAWDTALVNSVQGFRLTGGPLVAKGKVMVGTVGRNGGGNYIVALDAETGKENWRFNVIPKSDEPGGNSWNGLPFEKRNGGSVWVAGSYDPVLNLAFFGVAQTYDTKPLRTPVNRRVSLTTAYTRIPLWRSTRIPASWSGISSICLTISGIWIGRLNVN